MKRLTEAFFLVLGLIIIIWSFSVVLKQPAPAKYQSIDNHPTIEIGEKRILVEVARTPEERERGLSERESLPKGTGLLFVFETPGIYPFWMKDMHFPIDIIFIDENWVVITLHENISPETYPALFPPERPAQYALELNAGEVKYFNITIGKKLNFGD